MVYSDLLKLNLIENIFNFNFYRYENLAILETSIICIIFKCSSNLTMFKVVTVRKKTNELKY